MRRSWIAHLIVLAGVISGAATTAASDVPFGEIPYGLTANSAWLEGCIVGPCLCPVAQLDDLTGHFVLVELPTLRPGPTRFFEVRDLRWSLGRENERIEIRGSGLYQSAAPVLDQQRLVLDLQLGNDPIRHLDSGVVAGALSFPRIGIQALTSGECFQEGVQLAAAPVPGPSQGLQQLASLLALGCMSRVRMSRSQRSRDAFEHPSTVRRR